MPYRYDIFLSYPRVPIVVRWLDRFFEPHLSDWLPQQLLERGHALPRGQARIFRDQKEIGAGERWPRALREAARDTRCALAIMLPAYLYSPYCQAEWETFRGRGEAFDCDLLVPVRFHDCFDRVMEEEARDLSRYTAMVEDTPRWVDFQDEVKLLAGEVADLIVQAPEYPDDPNSPPWLAFDIPEPPPTPPIPPGRL